jgi:hypothetical protein
LKVSSRLDQIEDILYGLEDKVDELEHAHEDREKKTKDIRHLGHHNYQTYESWASKDRVASQTYRKKFN